MSNASTFMESFIAGNLASINTAMPCEVLSFDESTCTAKIQPLFMVKEVGKSPKNLPPIEGVPVLFQRYKIHNLKPIQITTDKGPHSQYQGTGEHIHNEITFSESVEMIPDLITGDIVQVVFNQRKIDDAINGKVVYPDGRMFSIHDAVIVGVFKQ